MRRCRLGLVVVAIAAGAGRADAQILNTLRLFADDAPGWRGSVTASFGQSGGNTEVLSLAAGAQVQHVRGRERLRLLGEATRRTSRRERIAESSVVHLRHNHRFSGLVHSLLFAQQQRNPFQRLQSRFLLGGGARLDVVRRERVRAAQGLATMLEIEKLEAESASRASQRLSAFTTLDVEPRPGVAAAVTAFLQPRWADFRDARALVTGGLEVDLARGLGLVWGASLQHDARPPAGVRGTDWDVRSGLTLKLGD